MVPLFLVSALQPKGSEPMTDTLEERFLRGQINAKDFVRLSMESSGIPIIRVGWELLPEHRSAESNEREEKGR